MPNSNSYEVTECLNELKSKVEIPNNFSVSGKKINKVVQNDPKSEKLVLKVLNLKQ